MDKDKYLQRHFKRAEELLIKYAKPYNREKDFVPNLKTIKWNKLEYSTVGINYSVNKKGIIEINSRYFTKFYKRKYDTKLIVTLMHEILHARAEWVFDFDYYFGNIPHFANDASPIFASYLCYYFLKLPMKYQAIWQMNNDLNFYYKKDQKELIKKIMDVDNLYKLESKMYTIVNKFAQNVKEINTKAIKNKELYIYNYNSQNNNNTNVELQNLIIKNETVKIYNFVLGMDLDITADKKKIKKYFNKYKKERLISENTLNPAA